MATTTEGYGEAITTTTIEYLEAVRTCTALLPAALIRYDQPSFEQTATQLSTRETDCDHHLRELRRLLGDADPNYSAVYLRSGELLELYALLDEVPNAAEQFVRDLEAIQPPLAEPTLEELAEMGALASRATWLLSDCLEAFISSLIRTGTTDSVRETVEKVGYLESQADDRKYTVTRRLFERRDPAQAQIQREMVNSLDATLDAAEDAADRLLFIASATR
jgi:uncharacterized protein Yka (UPF0111/DUF47 family)